MGNGNPFQFNFGLGYDDEDKKKYKNELIGSIDEDLHNRMFDSAGNIINQPVFDSMWSAEKSRLLGKKQKLFDIAAEGGAQGGGPAIGGGGTSGIGYAPQRDITKTFPGAMSKEEEEYLLALRGPVPGMMTYRGMS